MTRPRFRLAAIHEAKLVKEISAKAYIPAYQLAIGAVPKPAFEEYTNRIANGEVWIAETDGYPSGVLVLDRHQFLTIYSVAVDPAFQGRGIGKAMLRQATGLVWRTPAFRFDDGFFLLKIGRAPIRTVTVQAANRMWTRSSSRRRSRHNRSMRSS